MKQIIGLIAVLVLGCGRECSLCCLPTGGGGSGTATCWASTSAPDTQGCEVSSDCADCSGCTEAKAGAIPHQELLAIPLVVLPAVVVEQLERGEVVSRFTRGGFTVTGLDPWDAELLLTDEVREHAARTGRTIVRIATARGVTYIKGRFVVDRERGVVSILTAGLAAVTWPGMSEAEHVRFATAKAVWQGWID
jgi:hypothetical protein